MKPKGTLLEIKDIKPLDRLLDFMSQPRALHRGPSRLHLDLCDFMSTLDDISCVGVTSIPLKDAHSSGEARFMRWVYNHKTVKSFYPEKVLDKITLFIKKVIFKDSFVEFVEIGEYKLVFYVIGIDQNQKYIAFNTIKDGLLETPKFFDILARYLRAQFEQVLLNDETKKLLSLVHVDDVTGLYNQRKLVADLDFFIDRYQKQTDPFAVLFIDIDHFKMVNDSYGHLVGTILLKEMGEVIRNVLREKDLVYRYGGDEFVILLPDVEGLQSKQVGTRLLKKIINHVFKVEGVKDFKLSVSIGVGRFPIDAKSKKDILSIADQMMYHAKNQGRGKVCFAGELYDVD
jgi:diguanylate cyclase (GGDEF)-like protein